MNFLPHTLFLMHLVCVFGNPAKYRASFQGPNFDAAANRIKRSPGSTLDSIGLPRLAGTGLSGITSSIGSSGGSTTGTVQSTLNGVTGTGSAPEGSSTLDNNGPDVSKIAPQTGALATSVASINTQPANPMDTINTLVESGGSPAAFTAFSTPFIAVAPPLPSSVPLPLIPGGSSTSDNKGIDVLQTVPQKGITGTVPDAGAAINNVGGTTSGVAGSGSPIPTGLLSTTNIL